MEGCCNKTATREKSKSPWANLDEKRRLWFVRVSFLHRPSSLPKTHTRTHTRTYQHAHPPCKGFEDSRWTWSGLAFWKGRRGWMCSSEYVRVHSMYEEHAHTLSTNNAVHEDEAQFGGKQWKTVVGLGGGGEIGRLGHMSISDSWRHSIRLYNKCSLTE